MKKLLKHLSPLAPDDSGACSVLYELGGIVVICDAGGCAGNVCGFDEPRWHLKRSALFSAGLRDMDAILGRDDRLVEKLVKVCGQVEGEFAAIIGTPVPAVIATDYKALMRMTEKRAGLPCITIETDGTKLYDYGEELAYYKIFQRFAEEKYDIIPGKLGVLGATPLNTGLTKAGKLKEKLGSEKWTDIVCFGLDSGLGDIRRASECEEILVISPSGLKTAEYLKEKFGTPYRVGFPGLYEPAEKAAESISCKKVLIVHQQFAANELREHFTGCEVDCATWFTLDRRYAKENDFRIDGEETLVDMIARRGYDVVFADPDIRRMLGGWGGEFIDFPHYAVSAAMNE
ncbi:MAG: hypothetical protein IJ723_05625 [Ruminococcus sp.]|nr:hypothetical protein [Ruminococcus sp.]